MPNLFVDKRFTSHSGLVLPFKVECDALTPEDWECLAHIVHEQLSIPAWRTVLGIPTGGYEFARALSVYNNPEAPYVLVADDVFTTGRSMEDGYRLMHQANPLLKIIGVVAFARAKCPDWITPIWQLNPKVR